MLNIKIILITFIFESMVKLTEVFCYFYFCILIDNIIYLGEYN